MADSAIRRPGGCWPRSLAAAVATRLGAGLLGLAERCQPPARGRVLTPAERELVEAVWGDAPDFALKSRLSGSEEWRCRLGLLLLVLHERVSGFARRRFD
jgi:hypothetical protein